MEYYNDTMNDRWIIECVFPGKRNGFFLEAGAANGRHASSCYVLEHFYEWKGICVEPGERFFDALVQNRPNSICENVCLSDASGTVRFVEAENPYFSRIRGNIKQFKKDGQETVNSGREVERSAISLAELLRRHDSPSVIDYAAFDIEGSELKVLSNFPFSE